MENNSNNNNSSKKQQQQQRANKSSAEAQRKSSDLYANNKTRNSRRREQLPTPRSEQQQRSTKQQQQQQQQQQQSAKLRPNVDKRPRARGGGGNGNSCGYGQESGQNNDDGLACTGSDNAYGSSGLAATGASYMRSSDPDYELNSVYAHGSKKQNLNHLLNFHCVPRQSSSSSDWHATGHGATIARRQPRYNKEQFLQANFQFVIRSSAKAQVNSSPDTLIDWSLIEQINIHTTEEPQCPICLYPPVAAKLTRCGHAYCWPCLLHYLSLSDKTWRKCPICYDAIHAADLKSCTILQQHAMNVGDTINFQLMRRLKGSIYIERYAGAAAVGGSMEHLRFPLLSAVDETKRFSKFLIAKRSDVAAIIERERRELLAQSDESCPEDVFTQQALLTLNERCDRLGLEPEEQQQLQPLQLVEEDQQPQAKTPDVDEKADDASVSSLGEASCSSSSTTSINNSNKYYYFYQSNDGQNIYLHPLNVKMLQACYGSLDQAPVLIQAQILQKEHHSMDEEHRRKFTCLGHLPLTCQFAVVEVELQTPTITGSILKLFKDDLLHRKKERQRREREERKREQHINEINDRQMGKLIASAANLNLSSTHEFPTCGFEEDLPAPRGALPIAIGQASSGPRYSSVAASPKQELWPSIGGASGLQHSPGEFHLGGAWGRAAPPPSVKVAAAAAASRPTVDEDNELRAVGPWALGELLVGALDQQKQQRGAKSNTAPVDAVASNKKQKKSKGKKMVPLFAVGMNRAP
ncbi:RING finger protein 10 [Drosophila grimshawi]|uniref:E3 ubiquitin-protein ligase RNF10 n=1 Tax=Drosophila grimshawi TaxID=7222 RepID=B4IZK2_DROGR|nr:RING finger protein 10 [Drosophila grimshawi]EDV97777.1 GH17054 [Drosophila grimshawi]